MKTNLTSKLINNPLGDPGMIIEFHSERRALQFDLGDLSSISDSEILKTSHVFISHTHMDHFIGFDQLLRVVFGKKKTIRLFGPENFIANVEGKLAGYTWNLVDCYKESLCFDVTEVHSDRLLKAKFNAKDQFRKSGEGEENYSDGILVDEGGFIIRTSILEHRIPCLGFALQEKSHINIRKDRLEEIGYQSGPWLNHLKQCICEGKPDDHVLRVPLKNNESCTRLLRELKDELVLITPGQKIAYIVDTVYNQTNKKLIINLVRDADMFFCESPFLAEEENRGLERYHLTSRQAGILAREANVKKLKVFHFSGRHSFRPQQLAQEAEYAFRGKSNLKTIKTA